jgi:hypothetical protein
LFFSIDFASAATTISGTAKGQSTQGDIITGESGIWRLALLDPPLLVEMSLWQQTLNDLTTAYPTLLLKFPQKDRWGRIGGQIYRQADDLWLQHEMVSQGAAVVRITPGDDQAPPAILEALLAAENLARQAKRGVWASTRRIEAASAQLSTSDGGLHIIEGTIQSVSEVRSVWYLNFGADWRGDFTVRLDRGQKTAWDKAGLPPLESLSGETVRLRGWLRWANGPLIDLYSPLMLERLPQK